MRKRGAAAFLTLSLFCAPAIASASGLITIVPDDCYQQGGCQSFCDLAQLAQNVLNDAIVIFIFYVTYRFVKAGFFYLTASGDTEKAKKGKQILTNTAMGLVLVLSAWLIVDTVIKEFVGANPVSGPWNQLCTPGYSAGSPSSSGAPGTLP